ncbi:general stress protein [Paeniroseomonas aquatica]|uniref:KGG domain-containing protein n=1 Tax=Paeniroseomonas aquatica TaxID=373043 RepID=A0ABT8A2X9_9PROT|nr:KGG domain-containing protein [Paeniroseomonas aquatica]MDN3564090.1 KGG domain-containing protein [Paeniroseomonas aquatica]
MANQQTSGGGKGNPGNFANDRAKAREAGHIGGMNQGKANNPGNFANNREKAAMAGRKGGLHSHANKNPD